MDGYGSDRWHVPIKLHSPFSLIAASLSWIFQTLTIEANLDAFLQYLSNVFTVACHTMLDLAGRMDVGWFSSASGAKLHRFFGEVGSRTALPEDSSRGNLGG